MPIITQPDKRGSLQTPSQVALNMKAGTVREKENYSNVSVQSLLLDHVAARDSLAEEVPPSEDTKVKAPFKDLMIRHLQVGEVIKKPDSEAVLDRALALINDRSSELVRNMAIHRREETEKKGMEDTRESELINSDEHMSAPSEPQRRATSVPSQTGVSSLDDDSSKKKLSDSSKRRTKASRRATTPPKLLLEVSSKEGMPKSRPSKRLSKSPRRTSAPPKEPTRSSSDRHISDLSKPSTKPVLRATTLPQKPADSNTDAGALKKPVRRATTLPQKPTDSSCDAGTLKKPIKESSKGKGKSSRRATAPSVHKKDSKSVSSTKPGSEKALSAKTGKSLGSTSPPKSKSKASRSKSDSDAIPDRVAKARSAAAAHSAAIATIATILEKSTSPVLSLVAGNMPVLHNERGLSVSRLLSNTTSNFPEPSMDMMDKSASWHGTGTRTRRRRSDMLGSSNHQDKKTASNSPEPNMDMMDKSSSWHGPEARTRRRRSDLLGPSHHSQNDHRRVSHRGSLEGRLPRGRLRDSNKLDDIPDLQPEPKEEQAVDQPKQKGQKEKSGTYKRFDDPSIVTPRRARRGGRSSLVSRQAISFLPAPLVESDSEDDSTISTETGNKEAATEDQEETEMDLSEKLAKVDKQVDDNSQQQLEDSNAIVDVVGLNAAPQVTVVPFAQAIPKHVLEQKQRKEKERKNLKSFSDLSYDQGCADLYDDEEHFALLIE